MTRYIPPRDGYFVSLCLIVSFFMSAFFSLFIKQVREVRRIFRQAWGRLGYVSQMDEEQLSCWPCIFSILASINGTVVSRCSLFEYGGQPFVQAGVNDQYITPYVRNMAC